MPLNHKQNSYSAMTVVANQPMKEDRKRLRPLAKQTNVQKPVQKKKNHTVKISNGNLKNEHPFAESIIVSESQLKEILKSVGKRPASAGVTKDNQSQDLHRCIDEISKNPSEATQQKQSHNTEMLIHHEEQVKHSRREYSPRNFTKIEQNQAVPNKDQQFTTCVEKAVPLTLSERKKQQWLKEKAEQVTPYDPWGRPGAGAPKVNPKGQIITSYKNATFQSNGFEDNLNKRELPSDRSGQHAGFDEKTARERSEATFTPTTTTTKNENEGFSTDPGDAYNRRKMSQQPLPAAMRDNLFIGQTDNPNYEDIQRREQLKSQEELDQKKEEKLRILSEAGKHQQAESSRIESPTESAITHRSHLRGALTIHTDPVTQQQLEEKKRKNQELMLELKAQIDDQKKAKELKWKQKQLEEAEAERKMMEEQKKLRLLHETEIQLEKKKREAQEIHFQQLAANIELAREAAIKEKKLRRLQYLEKNGHDTSQLKKDFERNFNISSAESNYEIDQLASGTSISEDKHTPKTLPKSTAEQLPESQFQKGYLNSVSETGNSNISSQSNYDSNQLSLGTAISEHKQGPKILLKSITAQIPETQIQKVYLNCASQTDGIYGGEMKSLYPLIDDVETEYLYDDDDDVFIASAVTVSEMNKRLPVDNHNEMKRTIKPTNKKRQAPQNTTGSKPVKSSNQLPLLERKPKKNMTSRKPQAPTWETDGSNDQLVDYNTSNVLRHSCSKSHDPVTTEAVDELNRPPSPRVSRLRNKPTQPPPSRTAKIATTTTTTTTAKPTEKTTARTKSTTSPKSVFQKNTPARFSRHHSSPPIPTFNRKLQANKQNNKINSNIEVNKFNYDDYKRVPQQPQPLLKAKKYSDNSPLQGPVKEGDFIPFTRTSEVLDPASSLSPLPISREQSSVLRGRDRYRKGNDPANCGSPAPHFTDDHMELPRSPDMQDLQERKPIDLLSSTAAQEAFLKELSALRKKLKQMELESSTVLSKTHSTYQSSLINR